MNPRLDPLHTTLNLNARLFLSALGGVTDDVATTRPNSNTNHMAFIACHLLDARHYLAEYTGLATDKPFKDILEGAKGIEDIATFPALANILSEWKAISERLSEHLPKLEEWTLTADSPQSFPVEDKTVLGGITFLLEHESHHIGQLAYLRRYFAMPPLDWF